MTKLSDMVKVVCEFAYEHGFKFTLIEPGHDTLWTAVADLEAPCWKCGGDGSYCWTCGEREASCECDAGERNIGICSFCERKR